VRDDASSSRLATFGRAGSSLRDLPVWPTLRPLPDPVNALPASPPAEASSAPGQFVAPAGGWIRHPVAGRGRAA